MNLFDDLHCNQSHDGIMDFNNFLASSSGNKVQETFNILQLNVCSIRSAKKMKQFRLFLATALH
jgi:hypothetical protein